MSRFWRYMLSTFRKEPVLDQLPSNEQLKEEVTNPEIDEIADSFDDYHPNTPSSSVEDDEDLVDREKDFVDREKDFVEIDEKIKTLENNEFKDTSLVNAFKNITIADKYPSIDLFSFSDFDKETIEENCKQVDLINFSDCGKLSKEEKYKEQINVTINDDNKIVILNDSETSSADHSTNSKIAEDFIKTGARPKILKSSLSSNYSKSVRSTVLDRSSDIASEFGSVISRNPVESKKIYEYPIIFVSPQSTISIHLRESCIVEMTVNKTIRVECQGKFSAASNSHGSVNCILHPDARILQQEVRAQCLFGKNKFASFTPGGVVFTMKPSQTAYVVSSTVFKGTTPVPVQFLRLPSMDHDFSLAVLYSQSYTSPETWLRCHEIVRAANYKYREDDSIIVVINGIFIRQDGFGNILINCHPRTIRISPQQNTISVRTHFVDMAVQEDEKAYVKRGVKRVHVSKSGMVISDGNCITAMDHFGHIVSST